MRQSARRSRHTTLALIAPLALAVIVLTPAKPSAQDLFELEVFTADIAPAGGYEVELHANGLSRGAVATTATASNHRPVHLSVEVTRGWAGRFETGLFVQTAPFGAAHSTRFAGGHVRTKIRIADIPQLPIAIAVGAEYTFNRPAFDRELQTLELRSVVDYRAGRLSLVANPSLEMVTNASDEGLEPAFDIAARAGWTLAPRVSIAAEYFPRPAVTRHLAPERSAHRLVFAVVDVGIAPRWELEVGAGHCVTSGEPWVMKSVIGYRF